MENEHKESKNFVEVALKKSSSKDGGVGYDVTVRNADLDQKRMDELGEVALKTAMKIRHQLQ